MVWNWIVREEWGVKLTDQHRMGQTRPVTAIKLMINNSVEQKLHALQLKKANLAQISLNKLSRKDLMAQKVCPEDSSLHHPLPPVSSVYFSLPSHFVLLSRVSSGRADYTG